MKKYLGVMAAWIAACSSSPAANPDGGAVADSGVVADSGAVADSGGGGGGEVAVELRFDAVVGAQPFSCAAITGVGAANSPWTPLDFRFYVHDVQLVPEGGAPVPVTLEQDGAWQYRNVALLDFESGGTCANGTAATNNRVRGRVAAPANVRWTGLRFRLGVPAELNHQNAAAAPSPLNLSTLFWAWQSGYKFARIDGRSGTNAFNFHLGSTGCTGDPTTGPVTCAQQNRPEITLTGFDPTRNVVVADLARLLGTTDVSREGGGAPGCMSGLTDPECRTTFPTVGISMDGTPATQTFFSVR